MVFGSLEALTAQSVLIRLLFAMTIGTIIGIEREYGKEHGRIYLMGVRTSILIALLGFLFGFLAISLNELLLLIAGFFLITILGCTGYYVHYLKYKFTGLTTLSSMFIVFALGILTAYNEITLAMVVAIITLAFLAYRRAIHRNIKVLSKDEIQSAIKLGILAFAILPFLPNRTIDPYGLFNPFLFWQIVIEISAIFFFVYIMFKKYKIKGAAISSFISGLMASIPTVYYLAKKGNKDKKVRKIIPDFILVATAAGLVSNLIIIGVISGSTHLLEQIFFPTILASGIVLFLTYEDIKKKRIKIKTKNPFSIKPAIQFALLIIVSGGFIKLASVFSEKLSVIAVIISSFISVNAVIASIVALFRLDQIPITNALLLVMVAQTMTILNKLSWGRLKDFKTYKQVIKRLLTFAATFIAIFILQELLLF